MMQQLQPGQRVRVCRNHPKAGRLEATGVVVGYWRCGAWVVALEPHGCETAFDAHEVFPIDEEEKAR